MTTTTDQRDLSRWTGDGGMPLLGALGVSFEAPGDGLATAGWVPTELACNPHGAVQAGVVTVVQDAAMSLALLSRLRRSQRVVTISVTTRTMLPVTLGRSVRIEAEAERVGRRVCFASARVIGPDERVLASCSGEFMVIDTAPELDTSSK